jgi:hypothetical protein
MAAAPSPSSGQALVGVATVAAGVAAAYYASQKSEQIVDYTIAKTSSAYVAVRYGAADGGEGKKRGFLDRSIVGISKWVDQSAFTLEWKVRVMDCQSPRTPSPSVALSPAPLTRLRVILSLLAPPALSRSPARSLRAVDEKSPIKSGMIVTCVVGLLAALVTRKAISVAMR